MKAISCVVPLVFLALCLALTACKDGVPTAFNESGTVQPSSQPQPTTAPALLNTQAPDPSAPVIVQQSGFAVVVSGAVIWEGPFGTGRQLEKYSQVVMIALQRKTANNEWYERAGGGWVNTSYIYQCATEAACRPYLPQPPLNNQNPPSIPNPVWAPCKPGQIKGDNNTKIYLVAGQNNFDITKNNVTCFDSVAQAKAAGFTKSNAIINPKS